MTNSRQKGAAGERSLAKVLNKYGFETRRGVQYTGIHGDADVIGLPAIHIECKRVERLNIDDALNQAKRDAKDGNIPTVMHRKNNTDWKVTMDLNDWMRLYKAWLESKPYLMQDKEVEK